MAAPAYAVDIAVSGVEVTQATQTPTNSLRLVAGRSTAVRATLVNNDGGAVGGVTGTLHVFRNGTEITPAVGVGPINAPFLAPVAPQRANQNDTLNFELTGAGVTGLTASTDVDFRVDVTPVAGETVTGNNSGSADNLTVAAATTPSIFFTRINYLPGGLGLPSDSLIQPGVGDAMVKGILPVNDNDPNLYRQGLFPSLTYNEDDGDGILEDFDPTNTEAQDLINLLASCRQLIVNNGLGPDITTYLYGWLAGNPTDHNGRSTIPGKNAYGNTDPVRFQRTFAHEFSHLLGGVHPATDVPIDQVGWDVTARLPSNPATNNTTGRVKPTSLFEIMVPARLTNEAWIGSSRYSGDLVDANLGNGPDASPDAVKKRMKANIMFVQGTFNPAGTRLLGLEPVFRYPWRAASYGQVRGGRYRLIVDTVASRTPVVVPFDALTAEDIARGGQRRGFFEVAVPVTGQVRSIQVAAAKGRKVFTKRARSRRAPTIQVTTPRTGGKLGERTEVRWRVTDPDTPRAQLQYQVAYSPDGGRTFVPVGVDLRGTGFAFDSTQIQKSAGRGLIRVFVSDGLNTSFADVRGLSTSAARF
jgi:hypothetical protein